MWVAARVLGADRYLETPKDSAEDVVRRFGRASAFVRFMQAAAELVVRGRTPLAGIGEDDIAALARFHSIEAAPEKLLRRCLITEARPALLEGWQTHVLLHQIARDPLRVANGRVGLSPFRKKLRLLRWA